MLGETERLREQSINNWGSKKMASHLGRSIDIPVRELRTWRDRWEGPDQGLILCWEQGRRLRVTNPDLASRAANGELIPLVWKGGVQKKLEARVVYGTLKYLATWQGLRGDNLDIELDGERVIACTQTGQAVSFRAGPLLP